MRPVATRHDASGCCWRTRSRLSSLGCDRNIPRPEDVAMVRPTDRREALGMLAFGLAQVRPEPANAFPASLLSESPAESRAPCPLLMAGFRPDRLNRTVLALGPGCCATADGSRMIGSTRRITLDMEAHGPGGKDQHAPFVDGAYTCFPDRENPDRRSTRPSQQGSLLRAISSRTRRDFGSVRPGGPGAACRQPRRFATAVRVTEYRYFHLAVTAPMPYFSYTDYEDTKTWHGRSPAERRPPAPQSISVDLYRIMRAWPGSC